MRHLEAVVQRTNISRAIQFSAKYDGWHQTDRMPASISAVVSIEGDNNFRQNYAPALGVIVSRTVAERLALYAEPVWVQNSATGRLATRSTGFVGLGGFTIGDPEYAMAIEKRVGAHTFSLTLANGAQSTYRQLAHGGVPRRLYLGFNLSRKFY